MGAAASAPLAAATRAAPPKKKRTKKASVDMLASELARAYESVARAKAAARTAERDGALSYTECVLCFDHEIDTVFLPCGHACACRACVVALCKHHCEEKSGALPCPVCRKKAAHVTRIFVPRAEGARKVGGARPVLPDLSATWG